MAHYKTIWSPNGDLYEVAPDQANELVLNKGWFNSKPVTVEAEADPATGTESEEIVGDELEKKLPRKGGRLKKSPD